jgi:hypothetical protein
MPDRRSFLLVLLTLSLGLAAAPAEAAVKDCNVRAEVDTLALSHAGVSSVRNMSCRAARRVIRRNGERRKNAAYADAGSRFKLGRWSCTVYYHNYELWKARCTRGGKAFRVEYGF